MRYEIGIFRDDEDEAAAEGHFVHVFVDRAEEQPGADPGADPGRAGPPARSRPSDAPQLSELRAPAPHR